MGAERILGEEASEERREGARPLHRRLWCRRFSLSIGAVAPSEQCDPALEGEGGEYLPCITARRSPR